MLIDAIRAATLAELLEHGYAGVSFEGVARRAQTSKPVLYRRYRSRAHLVIDAWTAHAQMTAPTAPAEDLRGDLVAILSAMNARFQGLGVDAFRRIIAEADDDLVDRVASYAWGAAKESAGQAISRARDRGELGEALIPDRVVLLPLVLLRHELFFSRGPVSGAAVEAMVDQVCLPLLVAASKGDTA